MSNNKSLAVIVGVAAGIGLASAIGIYFWRHQEPAPKNVNEIFEQARQTVQRLDKAVEGLRGSAA